MSKDPLLSTAEEAVLRCVSEGLTNAQIAFRLGKRPATVKVQVQSILRKLGVPSRAAAAVWWAKRDLKGTPRRSGDTPNGLSS